MRYSLSQLINKKPNSSVYKEIDQLLKSFETLSQPSSHSTTEIAKSTKCFINFFKIYPKLDTLSNIKLNTLKLPGKPDHSFIKINSNGISSLGYAITHGFSYENYHASELKTYSLNLFRDCEFLNEKATLNSKVLKHDYRSTKALLTIVQDEMLENSAISTINYKAGVSNDFELLKTTKNIVVSKRMSDLVSYLTYKNYSKINILEQTFNKNKNGVIKKIYSYENLDKLNSKFVEDFMKSHLIEITDVYEDLKTHVTSQSLCDLDNFYEKFLFINKGVLKLLEVHSLDQVETLASGKNISSPIDLCNLFFDL